MDNTSSPLGSTNRQQSPSTERRARRRALISAPVRVRSKEVTAAGPDEISTTVNVSRGGFLFVTSHADYTRGMNVRVVFPYTSAPDGLQAEQDGRVVRVLEMEGGSRAVAIALGTTGDGEDLVDAAGRKLNEPGLNSAGQRERQAGKPLVLVVDSDPSLRDWMKHFLTEEGYQSFAVNNAADGVEILSLFTPALVIAEIEGENLPGYAICAHVKGTPRLRDVPVVLTTTSAYPSDYASAHSLGAVVCMAKPFKKERVAHIVRLLAPHADANAPVAPPRPPDPSRRVWATNNGRVSRYGFDSKRRAR